MEGTESNAEDNMAASSRMENEVLEDSKYNI